MDLNLVRTFVAVYETRNLSTAAARLYVTQPAVSQAVQRLRRAFDDQLFTRVGRQMMPSAIAVAAYPRLRDALSGIDEVLQQIRAFDPATPARTFRIALTELGEIGFLPAILERLHEVAPRTRLEVTPMSVEHGARWLETGIIDLAITSSPMDPSMPGTAVRTQPYCVVMGREHPLAGGLTLDEYLAADHAIVTGDTGLPRVESAVARAGGTLRAAISVTHFGALPRLLSRLPLLATVPDSTAQDWAKDWPLAVEPLPLSLAPLEVCLYTRRTTHDSEALAWFRDLVLLALEHAPPALVPVPMRAG